MSQLPSTNNVWLEIHAGLGISLMDHLFNRLDGSYPNKWRASFPTETSIKNWRESWAEKFIEQNLTPAEIKHGISKATEMYDWPPSLPEFIKACRPPFNAEAAFHEAVKQLRLRQEGKDTWSNKAIYWAAQAIGSADMNMPWQSIKGRWTKELNDMLEESALPDIPAFAVALPAPGKISTPPDEAHKRIEAAAKQIQAPTNNRAWAKRLIEIDEMGGKPNPVALQMAREVLGMVSAAQKQKLEIA